MPSIVFAGTPAFAAAALGRLLSADVRAAGFDVRAVFTQPDRPAGRGQRPAASAVKRLAAEHGLPVLQPVSLKDGDSRRVMADFAPDYLVVAAYGLILPPAVLEIPRIAPLNIHASLLPRWRGAAPIVRAIQHRDPTTGVCIMRMEAGLDTGPVCLRREIAIASDDTAGTLHDRLAALGAEALVAALIGLEAGTLSFEPQASAGVTYARKVDKREAMVDWERSAEDVSAQIRAFDPVPGSSGRLVSAPRATLRLFRPQIVDSIRVVVGHEAGAVGAGRISAVTADAVVVACGSGAVAIHELQRPGGRRLPAAAFLAGHRLAVGDRFLPVADRGGVQPVENLS